MEQQQAEQIVERHGQAVYRLAYARTGNQYDAEDVTQQTFLQLVKKAPFFRDEDHCRAWLLRVAANCAVSLFRSPWHSRTFPLEQAPEPAAAQVPEENLIDVVLALPKQYRLLIHLYYYEGYSASEISDILGVSEGAVFTRLSRARALLREMLKEDGDYV